MSISTDYFEGMAEKKLFIYNLTTNEVPKCYLNAKTTDWNIVLWSDKTKMDLFGKRLRVWCKKKNVKKKLL